MTRIVVNGVDLSAHVETVTFDPTERPVTLFRQDPVDESPPPDDWAYGIE